MAKKYMTSSGKNLALYSWSVLAAICILSSQSYQISTLKILVSNNSMKFDKWQSGMPVYWREGKLLQNNLGHASKTWEF